MGITGKNQDYLLVESDVRRIRRDRYVAWPPDAAETDPAFRTLYPQRMIA